MANTVSQNLSTILTPSPVDMMLNTAGSMYGLH